MALKCSNNLEKVLTARVATSAEHPVKAFAGLADLHGESLEPDCRVDQIPEYRPPDTCFADEEFVDRLGQQGLAEADVFPRARENGHPEALRSSCYLRFASST